MKYKNRIKRLEARKANYERILKDPQINSESFTKRPGSLNK